MITRTSLYLLTPSGAPGMPTNAPPSRPVRLLLARFLWFKYFMVLKIQYVEFAAHI